MKVKDLIKELQGIENPEKKIHLLGNEINGEDESTDIIFDILEIWDDGDESITLFLTNKKIDYEIEEGSRDDTGSATIEEILEREGVEKIEDLVYEREKRNEEERIEDIVDFELQEEEEEREWLKRVSLYKQHEKKK